VEPLQIALAALTIIALLLGFVILTRRVRRGRAERRLQREREAAGLQGLIRMEIAEDERRTSKR
jgi:hypothetical protein